jgi:CheY-like chemotaxis protein
MAQGIYNSGKRLSETLNFILDFSVAEADKVEVFPQNLKIVPVVNSCIEQFDENLKKKNLTLKTEFPVEDVYSSLDERLFKRIVYNLIDNAVKFTQTGGILVKVEKENIDGTPWSVLKVKDSGIGIKEENFNLIYEDFRQVSEGISRHFEGTGLGLTITKKTVELMGGTISVQSIYGEGTTFTVKFPMTKNPFLATNLIKTDKSSQLADASQDRFPVALYIEDDPINRDVMVMFLKKTCQVATAGSAEAALNMATSKRYDLFLVDINLGESMSGMEVVKSLLTMPDYSNTPIIAVTAYSMGNERSEFLRGGCTHYLAKPFRKRELIDLIESILL